MSEPRTRRVTVLRRGAAGEESDRVAVEEPLQIRARCDDEARDVAITMRTPGDDAELAAGFLYSEGIVAAADELLGVEQDGDNAVTVLLAPACRPRLEGLARNFYVSSSCGVCGKASLESLRVHARFAPGDTFRIDAAALNALPAALGEGQAAFTVTGGLHAAASFDAHGRIGNVREDIGRHNAADKLIGAALSAGALPLSGSGLLLSGRASFEVMQKALLAGCPMVAAVGAPSSLAVDLAWEYGLTLVGFLRDGRFNVYAGPARVG